MSEVSIKADKIAHNIIIPPTPETLMVVARETANEYPDVQAIIASLKKDVGLYSAILQMVNSPFLAVRNKITSVDQAVMMLGLPKVASIVRSVTIRANLGELKGLDNFWDAATEVAELCALFAREFTDQDPANAYALGMFHSCGIPVMMQSLPDYPAVVEQARQSTEVTLTDLEAEKYGFTNSTIAARLCEKWFLPDGITHAILYQGNATQAINDELNIVLTEAEKQLLSILVLAKVVSPLEKLLWPNLQEDLNEAALNTLEIIADQFMDYSRQCVEQIKKAG